MFYDFVSRAAFVLCLLILAIVLNRSRFYALNVIKSSSHTLSIECRFWLFSDLKVAVSTPDAYINGGKSGLLKPARRLAACRSLLNYMVEAK